MARPTAYESSQARDWIQATAATYYAYYASAAMTDPLTYCMRSGMETAWL